MEKPKRENYSDTSLGELKFIKDYAEYLSIEGTGFASYNRLSDYIECDIPSIFARIRIAERILIPGSGNRHEFLIRIAKDILNGIIQETYKFNQEWKDE